MKNNFVSGINGNEKMLPMHLWYRLLEQAKIMLNMIKPPRHNPKISAHAILEGTFYYNITPLAPSGTKVIVYDKPNIRSIWYQHGLQGWYIVLAVDHC